MSLQLPLRILVVDDDIGCLQSLELFLSGDGYETYTATRGIDALEVVRQLRRQRKRLDLSILDYEMPDQSGLDTYAQLAHELPGLEAILVTGVATETLEFDISTLGVRALVPKPVDIPLMRGLLEDFWREKRTSASAF